jgi:hypothetical protein
MGREEKKIFELGFINDLTREIWLGSWLTQVIRIRKDCRERPRQ